MSSTWEEDDLWEEPPARSDRAINPVTRRGPRLPARRVVLLVRAGRRAVLSSVVSTTGAPCRPTTLGKTADRDIRQHRLALRLGRRLWIFTDSRLQLASGPDDVLLEFLSQLVHPVLRADTSEAQQIVQDGNSM